MMANLTKSRRLIDIGLNFNIPRNLLLTRIIDNDRNGLRCSRACSKDSVPPENEKPVMSRAMEAYMKRARDHEIFMQQQIEEYNKGKNFLAKIMGKDPEKFSQLEVDEAIKYLFPSALFDTKARPCMTDPKKLYEKQKEAQFDYSGRPYHYLFYTSKQNFSELMHECAELLETLNKKFKKMKPGATPPKKALNLKASVWISKEALEKKLSEKLLEIDYTKFKESLELIAKHPFAYEASLFIAEYSQSTYEKKYYYATAPTIEVKDGVTSILLKGCRKKKCYGDVKLIHPGTGQIKINDRDFIDFFTRIRSRSQVLSPLVLTNMLGKVDVFATVGESGYTNQAMVLRYGISLGLISIVSEEEEKKLRLVGYLQRDPRVRERDKPGQRGARAKYTWLKR